MANIYSEYGWTDGTIVVDNVWARRDGDWKIRGDNIKGINAQVPPLEDITGLEYIFYRTLPVDGAFLNFDYLISNGVASIIWVPDLPVDKFYDVFVWLKDNNTGLSNGVTYIINNSNGTDAVYLDQTPGFGSGWYLLGTYSFNAGRSDANASVVLETTKAGAYADAVMFVPASGIVDPYGLENADAGGPYNSCNTAYVTWDVTGSTGSPNFINVEYVLANGTSLEVVSSPFSPVVKSDNSHSIVPGVETMQDTTVWIYFADDAADRHGDPGTSSHISAAYFSYIKGDVNGDNEIRVDDVLMYLKYVVKLPVDNTNPIDDLTCDNEIHVDDVLLVLRKVVGHDVYLCCPIDLP